MPRVLIVDDQKDVRAMVSIVLRVNAMTWLKRRARRLA